MSLSCHHPMIYHDRTGCTELLDLDENGYPKVCPCDRPGWGTG